MMNVLDVAPVRWLLNVTSNHPHFLPWAVALPIFAVAGVLESVHGYIGYTLAGQPPYSITLRGQPLSLWEVMVRAMPSWLVLGLLAGVALRVAPRHPIFSTNWKRSLRFHLPAAVVFSGTFLFLAATLRHFLFVGPETGASYVSTLLRYYTLYFNTFFLFYWGIVGIYSAFLYYRDLRQRDLQAEKLERQLVEARLEALQQQLEPHFLFNTLNAISGLALDGNVNGTVRTLSLLGELLRQTLNRREQFVTVAQELELLELYLEIQRIRLEERLGVRMHVDPDVHDAAVPTFLLQPIVENAVRHGIARDSRPGVLQIDVRRFGSLLQVTVTDSGPGLGSDDVALGMGLNNCVARLEQLYGAAYTFELTNAEEGGARVRVTWPYVQLAEAVHFRPSHPGPRSTVPGFAPVYLPPSYTTPPFTRT